MAGTISALDKLAKDVYADAIAELLPKAIPLYDYVEKKDVVFDEGRDYIQAIHIGRNQTGGGRGELTPLPGHAVGEEVGNEDYDNWKAREKYLVWTCQLSDPTIERMKSKKGAFKSAYQSEMDGVYEAVRQDLSRQMNGTGWGELGQIDSSVAGHDPTGTGVVGLKDDLSTGDRGLGARFLFKNRFIEAWSALGSAGVRRATTGVRKISARNKATPTITLAAAAASDWANNDYLFASNSRETDGAVSPFEIMGIQGHVDDATFHTTYQGVNRSTVPEAKGNVYGNSGTVRVLSTELMQIAIDGAEEEADAMVDLIYGHFSARRAFVKIHEGLIRYAPTEVRGGFRQETLSYAGGGRPIRILVGRHAPLGKLFFLTMSTFKWLRTRDFHWLDRGGAIWRLTDNKLLWEANYVIYCNFFCERPNANSVVIDLSYTL